jgi:hypothetical protein
MSKGKIGLVPVQVLIYSLPCLEYAEPVLYSLWILCATSRLGTFDIKIDPVCSSDWRTQPALVKGDSRKFYRISIAGSNGAAG